MSTESKVYIGMVGAILAVGTGIYGYVTISSDRKYQKRCEELHKLHMEAAETDKKATEARLELMEKLLLETNQRAASSLLQ